MSEELDCDVCRKEPALGVAAVPGVPVSVAYGKECLQANAHPYWIIVANSAAAGNGTLEGMADWWLQMCRDTCTHLNIEWDKFELDVATASREMYEADQDNTGEFD